MKKYLIYFLGVLIMAFGVSLCFQCKLGAGSIDALNKNITDAINSEYITVGRIVIIENLLFVLLYFIVFKTKDVILPIIVTFCLGTLIDLFNMIIIVGDNIIIRVLLFIVAINFVCLGVSLMVYNKMSPSAFECLTLIVNKFLTKLSFGTCKVIIEIVITILAAIIGLVFLKGFGEVSIATLIIMIFQGPFIDLYLKLVRKIKFLN